MATNAAAGQGDTKPGDGEKPLVDGKPAGEGNDGQQQAAKPGDGDGKTGDQQTGDQGEKVVEPPAEPTAPDAYVLTIPEKDSPFTDADLPMYSERAKRLNLTQKQAQALVETEAADITAANTKLLTDLKADPALGGDKLDASLALAKQGRDAVLAGLPEDERNTILGWLSDPKLKIGNHKALVRMFANIGQLLQEDTPGQGGGQRSKEARDAASVLWPDKG